MTAEAVIMPKDKAKQDRVPQILIAETEAAISANQPPPGASSNTQADGSLMGTPASHVDPYSTQPIEQRPPPPYGDEYGRVDLSQDGFSTEAKVASDGRLDIRINQQSRAFSNLVVPTLKSQLSGDKQNLINEATPVYIPSTLKGSDQLPPPPLNVVVHVVGSRGDVQPFIALGKVLKESYGHRVRLATHSTFRTFAEENGLEFFNIGGDPAELMAFMVKNPGLMPGMDSLKSGDVGRRRKGMYEIIQGCWRSCYELGDGTGVPANDETLGSRTSLDSGIEMEVDPAERPFVADAIIANPPSFAHIHCAERLGIPLHLMFTMPWSPTQAFPHPLANIESSNADASLTNFISYVLVEMMTWQGLGDMINRFREKSLGLEPLSLMYAPGMACRLQIPYTYCWSPALIPKPADWGLHVSISGFYFLSLASTYSPDKELEDFLQGGPPPVYIGFGSIVVDDPNGMTKLIFEAVKKTGQRALVSKGWGGFGTDTLGVPDGIFMLGNVPHDWLFSRVSCVVHHGGAGTTAAGVALGKPTVVVPFFGDQPFWGAMISKAGAGPKPIPQKQLSADNLAAAILEALKPSTLAKAQELGTKISSETGTLTGARSFHQNLRIDSLRCSLAPSRAAVWRVKRTKLLLSAFAAATLGNEGLLEFTELKLYRPKEYENDNEPLEPFSGAASALLGSICGFMMGAADIPVEVLKALRIQSTADSHETPPVPPASNSNTEQATSGPATESGSAPESSDVGARTENQANATVHLPTETATGHKGGEALAATNPIHKLNSGAIAGALGGTPGSSRSSSLSREPSQDEVRTSPDVHTRRSSSHMTADAALGAGKGISRMVGAGVKSPMDFTLALARGFHNAPKLYGDDKVRAADRITDFQSGLRAAGKEFGYGFYDGITGLVTQPLDGARKDGVAGFVKGFGKGVGGMMLKPAAAIWGLPGYTFKGLYKEIQKHFGTSVENYIIAARTSQGFQEWNSSSQSDREEVIKHWRLCQHDLQRQRDEHRLFHSLTSNRGSKNKSHSRTSPTLPKTTRRPTASNSPSTTSSVPQLNPNDPQSYEAAIQASVAATSIGDADQDQMIERAIRASIQQLQVAAEHDADDGIAMNRAIQASIAMSGEDTVAGQATHKQHQKELEQLPKYSLHKSQTDAARTNKDADSGLGPEDEKALSNVSSANVRNRDSNVSDADLDQALASSQQSHEAHLREREQSEADEEAVLRYVQRLSAFEASKGNQSESAP